MSHISRRTFVQVSASLLAAPFAVEAQPAGRMYRIGFLRAGPALTAWVEAFEQGLREHGYAVGQNVVIEFRLTDGGFSQVRQLADELVRSKVDVILTSAAPPTIAAKQ